MNTNNYLIKAKEVIAAADIILVGAGAGLSTSAGIDYGKEAFAKYFKEYKEKYNMSDVYTSGFYEFDTQNEKWAYWAKHIDYCYIHSNTNDLYKKLLKIISLKNYFVLTTNADGQFLKEHYDMGRVFEIQGSYRWMQCKTGKHKKLYNIEHLIENMLKQTENCKIPDMLIPKCPVCGENMDINVRKDNTFVEDDRWNKMYNKYIKFISFFSNKKVVLLELGAGFNTPGIIRYPFEAITNEYDNVTLIRINDTYPEVPQEIINKSISIKRDIYSFLSAAYKMMDISN